MTANADVNFTGTVNEVGYIESEGDTYDYMYEYTVPSDATGDEWYQHRGIQHSSFMR